MALLNRRTAWIWYLGVGLVPTLLYSVGPQATRVGPLFNLVGISSVVAVLVGVRMNRPRRPEPWYFMAAGLALFAIGDLITYNYESVFGGALPFPSVGDFAYLAVYPCLAIGVFLLIRARNPVRDIGSFIDALMFGIAAGVVSWVFLIEPTWSGGGGGSLAARIVSVAYPFMDLVLLLAIVRVAVGAGERGPAFGLLAASIACLLVTDSIYGLGLGGIYSDGNVLDIGWGLFYLLWGAAALHPSMTTLTEPSEGTTVPLTRDRIVLLLGTALIVQVIRIVQLTRGVPVHEPAAIAATTSLFVLMVVRLTVFSDRKPPSVEPSSNGDVDRLPASLRR